MSETASKFPHGHDPNARQALAADPLSSVWVSASAGTGKTKILTDRVLRLMLPRPDEAADSATPPDKILCLTYTKTGAAEMAERIHKRLSEWAVMAEEDLIKNLRALLHKTPDETVINAARALFAQVVDTPGGMKIMTIHSFCQSVLKRFPLEAGLPAHFEVLDERTAQEYMTRAQRQLIETIREVPDTDLAHAFTHLTTEVNAEQFQSLMKDLTAHRNVFARLKRDYPTAQALQKTVFATVGCTPDMDEISIFSAAQSAADFKEGDLRIAVKIMVENGTKTDIERADVMQAWLDAPLAEKFKRLDDYKYVFLKKTDLLPKAKMTTQTPAKVWPDITQVMLTETDRLLALHDRFQNLKVARHTWNLVQVGMAILDRYQNIKWANIQLDYDDLISHTRTLLADTGQAAWVLYKMDQGVDHILVDEAQDTSPAQWEIIRTLALEFFEGQSARSDVSRTIFVVGDEKQSIFSFQGADPTGFDRMRNYFKSRIRAAEQKFESVNLLMSFRSTPAVLDTVDEIFRPPEIAGGVQSDITTPIQHLPFRMNQAGRVELWPVIANAARPQAEPWTPPSRAVSSDTAETRLAYMIAETIHHWLKNGEILAAQNRPVRAGDIMILFRNRTTLLEHIVRALKQYRIPVSGTDRIVLTDHLAVQDCLAMADCALLPQDDLRLATILKSPFIGYSDEDLFKIAYDRPGHLIQSLRDYDPDTWQYLRRLSTYVQTHTPYDFLQHILLRPCPGNDISGRRALYARLGLEIDDALDEVLNSCLDFERLHSPAMQNFLSWFRAGQAEVKREQESGAADQVRLMTVHGSKGLQAPIVFLPDTVRPPHARFQVLWGEENTDIPLWAPRDPERDSYSHTRLDTVRAKDDAERRRLLYVALTRAEDRLYICGAQKDGKIPEGSWYDLAQKMFIPMKGTQKQEFTMAGRPVLSAEDESPLSLYRYDTPQTEAPKQPTQNSIADTRTPLPKVPDWLHRPPPEEPSPPRPLAPSRPSEDEPAIRSPLAADDSWRFARGNLVHQLLEILPQLPEDRREAACRAYLGKSAHGLNAAQQNELTVETLRVLHHPEFAPIFGPNSRAEVPIVGLIDKKAQSDFYAISGQIDRMAVKDDRILIIDYKTNRPPPTRADDVPDIYCKQMAAYKAALQRIYPEKQIDCALLWTDGPDLMPLPDTMLEKFLPKVP